VVGLSEKEFYRLSPRSFNNVLNGYNAKYREKMELHREMLVTFISPNLKEKDRKKTLQQLMPLPWEDEYKKTAQKPKEKKASTKLSEDEIKRIQKSYKF